MHLTPHRPPLPSSSPLLRPKATSLVLELSPPPAKHSAMMAAAISREAVAALALPRTATQRSVGAALAALGLGADAAQALPEGLCTDFRLTPPLDRLVVEVGPRSHYLHPLLRSSSGASGAPGAPPPSPSGAARFKRRLLRAMGYRVVVVDYWDWDSLEGGLPAQGARLHQLLQEACAPSEAPEKKRARFRKGRRPRPGEG